MFKYTVRNRNGSIRSMTNSKKTAEKMARQSRGYVKKYNDPVNPRKEEI